MKKKVVNIILVILIALLSTAAYHIDIEYQNLPFEQILYHLNLSNTAPSIVFRILYRCIVPFLFFLLIICLPFLIKKDFTLTIKNKKINLNIFKAIQDHKSTYLGILLIFSMLSTILVLNIPTYIFNSTRESDFFKNNYANPRDVKITFPEEKRNLIYIFLESMESTLALDINGGYWDYSIIPELEQLAASNVNFSHNNDIGGFYEVYGTGWTVASMIAQTSGIPFKVSIDGNKLNEHASTFLPGAYSIGQILEKEGYNQTLLLGSEGEFGGRSNYFTEHGNYNIIDYNEIINRGYLDEDYYVWWGYEDKKLFEYAKEELLYLNSLDEPFNLTMLTVDTHFFNGYLDETCDIDTHSQYENVYSCSSRLIYNFIEWIKEQDFYNNTTIVIAGDHLTMQASFIEPNATRTIYNTFINSPIKPLNEKNRIFSAFDMFPTTLASLNVKIEGDKLGLGTNLFSDQTTLTEEHNLLIIDQELAKKSSYYNGYILKESYFEIYN